MLRQIIALGLNNLRSIPSRIGPALVMVLGTAGVFGVMTSMVSIREAYVDVLSRSASPNRVLVLGKPARLIYESSLDVEHQNVVAHAPGVKRSESGKLLVTEQTFVSLNVKGHDGYDKGVMMQGTNSAFFDMLPAFRIVEGRMFREGLYEFVVGRAGQSYFRDTRVGDSMTVNGLTLTVVGVFTHDGDFLESSFLMDGVTLRALLGRTTVNAMEVEVEDGTALAAFTSAIESHPSQDFSVVPESVYYDRLVNYTLRDTGAVMTTIILLMSIAGFACAATVMYASVASHQLEMATCRALGFGATVVVMATVIEALLLGSIGGVLGSAGAWYFFDAITISSTDGTAGLVTEVDVSPLVLLKSAGWLASIALFSALLPALQSIRVPLALSLRMP